MTVADQTLRTTARTAISSDRYLLGRVTLLYDQAAMGIIGAMVCALVVGIAFSGAGDPNEVAIWTAGFAALSAFRLWTMRRYSLLEPSVEHARRWSRVFVALCFVSGLWWGYGGVALVDDQPEQMRMFIYVIIGALCAGAVATYASVLPAFIALAVGAIGPLIVDMIFFNEDEASFLVGILIVLFSLILTGAALKQSETIRATLRIQFDNVGLIEVLETAMDDAAALNDSLTAEIRQRERIEQDLARSLALHQATMDAVDEGILALDQDQQIVAINQRFRHLWGLRVQDAHPGISGDAVERHVEDLLKATPETCEDEDGGAQLVELIDGRIFERAVVPCKLDDQVIGRVRTIRDVSRRIFIERELREAKELAEQSSRAKSDFLAHISHELRTPLNAIIGFSEIYLEEMFGSMSNGRYMDYAKDIHDSANLLLSLINDILDLSKIEAGRIDLVDEQISVLKTARQSLRLIRSRASDAGLKIEFAVPMNLPVLRCDERALKQMLVNLLSNAVKFTPKGGHVILSAAVTSSGEMAISICDNGIGLSSDQIAHALEPFGQIEHAMNRQHAGTGLGLPLVKALIEAHGGRLEIESVPKTGSTMHLLFPADRLGTPTVGDVSSENEVETETKTKTKTVALPRKTAGRKRRAS